jgi:hypothetical protein
MPALPYVEARRRLLSQSGFGACVCCQVWNARALFKVGDPASKVSASPPPSLRAALVCTETDLRNCPLIAALGHRCFGGHFERV